MARQSEYEKLMSQLNALKRRLQQQQQREQDKLRSRNQESTLRRDVRTAEQRLRAAEEDSRVRITDPSRAAAGTGQYGPPMPRRLLRDENGRLVAPSQTQDTEFAGPARDRATNGTQQQAAPQQPQRQRVTTPVRGTSGSTRPAATPGSAAPSPQQNPTAPSPQRPQRPGARSAERAAEDAGLYEEDFSGMGRLGAALKATQDEILKERGIKRGVRPSGSSSGASTPDDGTRGTGPVRDGQRYAEQLRREEERRRRREEEMRRREREARQRLIREPVDGFDY